MFNNRIGSGSFGEIFLQKDESVIKRQELTLISARELYYLYTLNHPSILKPQQAFLHKNRLCIKLPYVFPLSKFDDEDMIDQMIEELLEVVNYLHSQGISHRDICTDNILFARKLGRFYLIDLGTLSRKKIAETFYCHPNYTAPETLKEDFDSKKADIWSLGMVILNQIAFYECPRIDCDDLYFFYRGKFSLGLDESDIDFKFPKFKPIVEDMLQFDPNKRLTAEQLLRKYYPNHKYHKHIIKFDEEIEDCLNDSESVEKIFEKLGIMIRVTVDQLRKMIISSKIDLIKAINAFSKLVRESKTKSGKIDLVIEFFEYLSVDQTIKFFNLKDIRDHRFLRSVIDKCDEFLEEDIPEFLDIMPRCKHKIFQALYNFEMKNLHSKKVGYYHALKC